MSVPLAQPHLMVLNGVIHTLDPAVPTAEAVAIAGNRILAVGSTSTIRGLCPRGTPVIDAGGGSVLPGFNDAHVHFLSGGFSLTNIDLRSAASAEDLARRLAEWVNRRPPGSWVLGGDWDHERWEDATLPTRDLIDAVTPEHPVLVTRLDGHCALANTLALRLAGITKARADPPGGLIVREPVTGEPTGLLKDAAMVLVERAAPPPTFEQKLAAARAATAHAARFGVTSVTDVSADADVGLYQYLLERGELKTRIYAARSIVSWEPLAQVGVRAAFGSDMLRIGLVKGFSDGSLGSTTALFLEPYADAPQTRGILFDQMFPEGIMHSRVAAADKHGLQIALHAIGDAANRLGLEIFEAAARENGPRDRRFRIEHAQHLHPEDLPRFASLSAVASMQPYHAADDGRWCDKRIGPERSKGAYAFRSLLDSGAILAFGSDWTVAPLDPLPGLKAAVTRQTLDGGHPDGWQPAQKISLEEALRAYTWGSAFAEFAERDKGTLSPGKLADLVVLDRDLHSLPPGALDEARVLVTVLDGRVTR